MQEGKLVVWVGLINSWERREVKGKRGKQRYTQLSAGFQRRAGRDKKAFLSKQCREIEENNRTVKTKAMAPHSSTLAWKVPWMEEPGRLQSMWSRRVGHDEWLHFHFSLSYIGEGNGNQLQCSCLENPRDRGAWWATISGVAQSRTRLKRLSSSSSRDLFEIIRDTKGTFHAKMNAIKEINVMKMQKILRRGGKNTQRTI